MGTSEGSTMTGAAEGTLVESKTTGTLDSVAIGTVEPRVGSVATGPPSREGSGIGAIVAALETGTPEGSTTATGTAEGTPVKSGTTGALDSVEAGAPEAATEGPGGATGIPEPLGTGGAESLGVGSSPGAQRHVCAIRPG